MNVEDYWLGLEIAPRTERSPTAWYDGKAWTYRNWADPDPDEVTECITYSNNRFRDRACYELYYYTCKKPAGNVSVFFFKSRILTSSFYSSS